MAFLNGPATSSTGNNEHLLIEVEDLMHRLALVEGREHAKEAEISTLTQTVNVQRQSINTMQQTVNTQHQSMDTMQQTISSLQQSSSEKDAQITALQTAASIQGKSICIYI
jgi:chromosome segregation ATPase